MCIKSSIDAPVDSAKVKEIITTNGIQVSKASVNKKNGDLYVDLPSNENRDKLVNLLSEEVLPGNRVINLKEKHPTISIRGVSDYTTEKEFITKVKQQNEQIKERLESEEEGSVFSVVFTKKHTP